MRTQSQDEKSVQIRRPCQVRRSDQVTIFVVCTASSVIFEAVVLFAKVAINHRFLFNLVWGEWMDLRNSNVIELRNFHFTIIWKDVFENFYQK